jgi:hypothetical protein
VYTPIVYLTFISAQTPAKDCFFAPTIDIAFGEGVR